MAMDQSQHSTLFRLPFEVRLEIYSYLIGDTILHVEPLRSYYIDHQSDVARFKVTTAGSLLEAEDRQYNKHLQSLRQRRPVEECHPPVYNAVRSLQLNPSTGYRTLFRLYQCGSPKSFTSASACPPGILDHVDCGNIKEPSMYAIRLTCRQAYAETAALAKAATSQTALQFACLQDLTAFSMLLSDDVRGSIRHLRLNFDWPISSSQEPDWLYFCNVFATPWDRRSLQPYFEGSDYPNHKAEISFYYNRSPWDLFSDDAKALASSWVAANVSFSWPLINTSWSTRCDLSDLKAHAPLSLRFAMPQFFATGEDGETDFETEDVWDDEVQDVIQPGDERHVRSAERFLIDQFNLQEVVIAKKAVLACKDRGRQEELRKSYDVMSHRIWHGLPPEGRSSHWGWFEPLKQCQSLASFDIDFYDENGPRSTIPLGILRDGLKEHCMVSEAGPHPCLYFRH